MSRLPLRPGLSIVVDPARREASLWRRYRFEEQFDCRALLFDLYVELARKLARRRLGRRSPTSLERGDVEHLAYEGLLQAIDRFDPLNGAPFEAFARRRIAGSIADGIATLSEVGAQIRARYRARQERLRSVADSDVSQGQDSLAALSEVTISLALGLMLEDTGLVAFADGADPRPSAYDSLAWRELHSRMHGEVEHLPEREALIVRQHYYNGLSFGQIADLMGLSKGRISQLHRAALSRLRKRIGRMI